MLLNQSNLSWNKAIHRLQYPMEIALQELSGATWSEHGVQAKPPLSWQCGVFKFRKVAIHIALCEGANLETIHVVPTNYSGPSLRDG